jgi:hypothetical protein
MSFIKNIFTSLVNFRNNAACDGMGQILGASRLHNVQLEKKIRAFISSIYDIDQSKLSLFLTTKKGENYCGGFLELSGRAFIVLNPHELFKKAKLTKEGKFIIAHEVAHIVHDDAGMRNVDVLTQTIKTQLVLAAVWIVRDFVRPPEIQSLYEKALFYLGSGGVLLSLVRKCQMMESEADIEAAKKSLEIAEGGSMYLERLCRESKAKRLFSFWQKELADANPNPFMRNLKALGNTLLHKIFVDSDGNNRFLDTHPPHTQRIATCLQISRDHISIDSKTARKRDYLKLRTA